MHACERKKSKGSELKKTYGSFTSLPEDRKTNTPLDYCGRKHSGADLKKNSVNSKTQPALRVHVLKPLKTREKI